MRKKNLNCMSQFFISCKESRIETNKSFYGCFYLGPFEPSQSITIANALRRTLLSELYGLAIVSVEIEGATHEYSTLPGIKDSVLDILLNLKEIVLKKTIKNFKPQVGYLRVRGPGVVRASHFHLPSFIQCVDPNQYIATLADNGFLNMKFIIQYGNKWLSTNKDQKNLSNSHTNLEDSLEFSNSMDQDQKNNNLLTKKNYKNNFNLHLKKRRLIFKKLKQIGIASTNLYINMLSQKASFLEKKKNFLSKRGIDQPSILTLKKKYSGINLKMTSNFKKLSQSIEKSLLEKKKNQIKQVFTLNNDPINLQPSVKKLGSVFKSSSQKEIKNRQKNLIKKINPSKKKLFFNSNPLMIDAIFNPISKVNYIIEINDFKAAVAKMEVSQNTAELYELFKVNSFQTKNLSENENTKIFSEDLESLFKIKDEIDGLTKKTVKHNITLEIWTNGSIHPRDALYQSFKNLIKVFLKLNKINTLASFNENLISNTQNLNIPERFNSSLIKKLKMGAFNTTFMKELIPITENSFLSSYVNPGLKNVNLILSKKSLLIKEILENPKENLLIGDKELKDSEIYQTDIGNLNLSLRSYSSLKRFGINSLGDLITLSKTNLSQLKIVKKKLGQISVKEITGILKKIGLEF